MAALTVPSIRHGPDGSYPKPKRSAHIDDLPPEILVSILMLHTFGAEEEMHRSRLRMVRVPFYRGLSQVSRRWRTITLAFPGLWSVVPHFTGSTASTELRLSRCSVSPIDFVIPLGIPWTKDWCQKAIRLVLPHLSRVRSLDLCLDMYIANDTSGELADHPLLRDLLHALATQPMPLLEDVNIDFCSLAYWKKDYPVFNDPRVPKGLLTEHPSPRLKKMSMCCCITPMPSPFFASSLRHLELHDVRGWKNVDDMIIGLQLTPLLESFTFADDSSFFEVPSFDVTRSNIHPLRCVRLDNLTYMQLSNMAAFNAVVFSYLAIPCSARVFIYNHDEFNQERFTEDHLTMLVEALQGHFSPAAASEAQFGRVDVKEDHIRAIPNNSEIGGPSLLAEFRLGIPYRAGYRDPIGEKLVRCCLSLPVFCRAGAVHFSQRAHKLQNPAIEEAVF
ncbi:hypothetical protein PENSPDRAFT_130582 [Peniophora sp. CONT]|nr:hypothetical protein PENSPDRAFT_130582 [Peniophora sp. CONT]